MSKNSNPIEDYVFSLSDQDFELLCSAVDKRIDKQKYGVTSFEDAALHYGRKPSCPQCGSASFTKDGYTNNRSRRYRCSACGTGYTLLSNSIFNSSKIPFHKLMQYVNLMEFNVPLEMCCEIIGIASNTAELWRKKIFQSVTGYQDHLILSDTVFIDETYIEDYQILGKQDGKHLRGLSRTKICIVVAIDIHKNMVAIICGHGKPSSRRISNALEKHIKPGSKLIHDGEKSHNKLIDNLKLDSEVHKADSKDQVDIDSMALINNMCGWLKRYINRFIGMDVNNLQSYLNWFIYLHRVKEYEATWPKNGRILRHLVLESTRFTRKY